MTIKNFAFSPEHFTVTPDERVVVTNTDSVAHTFTAEPGTRSRHFTSGDIAPGRTVTVVAPTTKGSYSFYCAIHPFMTGAFAVT